MKIIHIILLLILSSCQNSNRDNASLTSPATVQDTAPAQASKPADPAFRIPGNELALQQCTLPAGRDTTIIALKGSSFRFWKNTFVDSEGRPVKGRINLVIKECLDPIDMVIGNMTTTTNGQFLQSGGMIYLDATSENGGQLYIARGKDVLVTVAAGRKLKGMQMYEGLMQDGKLNWVNPVKLADEAKPAQPLLISEDLKSYTYTVDGSLNENTPGYQEIMRFIGEESRKICLRLKKGDDTNVVIKGYSVNVLHGILFANGVQTGESDIPNPKTSQSSFNSFAEDQGTRYIFSMKKLGWANIDRLFSDPRTRPVQFVTNVKDHSAYDNIYISMVFKNQNMYLPGYQRTDNTFSFTHGDFEKPSLPIGETASIIMTAYKGDKLFYAIETFTITSNQHIELKPMEGSKENLKKMIESI